MSHLVTNFFDQLWKDYTQITPQAQVIHDLFLETDGAVLNDHVAFRTFADTPICLDQLEPVILSLGYVRQDSYHFASKSLRAHSFIHPDVNQPKIFCSELLVHELSAEVQAIIQRYTAQITASDLSPAVFWSGRHWGMPTWDDYQQVMQESEYGAWLLAIGVRVNHFTVSVNALNTADSVAAVLARVKAAGFAVNTVGGEVKGSQAALLEQGSTMADQETFIFAGGDEHRIPTCFYEFAQRFPDQEGVLYQGFVEANADKIFESTHAR